MGAEASCPGDGRPTGGSCVARYDRHWRRPCGPISGVLPSRISCGRPGRVSDEAADRMADMKKQDMAEAAEQLLAERLAARADADPEPCKSARAPAGGCFTDEPMQTPTPPSDRHSRDRNTVPALYLRLSKFLAARHQARGQRHDPHSPTAALSKGTRSLFLSQWGRACCVRARYPAPEEDMTVDPVGSVAVAAGPDQRVAVVAVPLHQRGVDRGGSSDRPS